METRSLLDCAEQILGSRKEPLHVNDLAIYLADAHPVLSADLDRLPTRLSAALSNEVKKSGSRFGKVKNGQGGYRKGIYRLKKKLSPKTILPVVELPATSRAFVGKAGEHAVLSELLFWGFNASLMAVDDGIDIVASKDNEYFHIQVKTANLSGANGSNAYGFGVKREKFVEKSSAKTFYIFVARKVSRSGAENIMFVFPNSDISRFVETGIAKGVETISFRISERDGDFIVNGSESVMRNANALNLIR